MSRFNSVVKEAKTATSNLAGGPAYTQSPEVELVGTVLGSFLKDMYYESANERLTRIQQLCTVVPNRFIGQLAIYARKVFGMRTTAHVLAGEYAVNEAKAGTPGNKNFFKEVIYRPDDMLEIVTYYLLRNGGDAPLPNALKKGFAAKLRELDAYQLGKYKSSRHNIKLVDLVNLVRPVPTEPLNALMNGTLESPMTWEVLLSAATTPIERTKVWLKLLSENRLGYLALIRNLANILDTKDEHVVSLAADALTDEAVIQRSLIFPFQLQTSYNIVSGNERRSQYSWVAPDWDSRQQRKLQTALSRAVMTTLSNIPKLEGRTAVFIDTSGSMNSPERIDTAVMFGIATALTNDADIIPFADRSYLFADYTEDSNPFDVIQTMRGHVGRVGYGTNLGDAIYNASEKYGPYHRYVIFSDMQCWAGRSAHQTGESIRQDFARRWGRVPFVYSFDLTGYGTSQFQGRDVSLISGFSHRVFDYMGAAEDSPLAQIEAIRAISW